MPLETITISGEPFNVNPPYVEGHPLTANEARQFNQTWREAVRNNLARRVDEQKESGAFDHAAFQTAVDEYASAFEFGARTGGGRGPADPVESEALDMARDIVRQAIKQSPNKHLKSKKYPDGITAEQITQAATNYLAGPKGEALRADARQRVTTRSAAAQDVLGSLMESQAAV